MKPLDRRVVRTRRMLRDALIALILEKGYDAITVQDITERADLRRATFYLHYKTKEQLLLATLDEMFEEVRQQIDSIPAEGVLGSKSSLASFVMLYEHVARYAALYRAILGGQGGTLVARRIRDYLAAQLLPMLPTSDIPAEVLANYIAGAELALVTWWLDSAMPYPAEQMAAQTQRLILDGVLAQLRTPSPPVPHQIDGNRQ